MHAITLATPMDHDDRRRPPVHAPASGAAGGATDSRPAADARLAAALMARAPAAERRAWIELSPVVRAVLRRELGPGPDEMDLCQEVFLRFFRRIDQLRDPDALRGFVVGISLGVARNQRRRAQVRRCVSLTATGDAPAVAGVEPSFEARQVLGRLQDLLVEADADDRALFLTRYVDHEHLGTIAAMAGCRIGAVKGRLARVVHRLSARMRRDAVLAPHAAALAAAVPRTARPGRVARHGRTV
jgi:RNA polymerase sigma-70 factor (ECF subfamily)